MIPLYVKDGKAYVWNAEDWFCLRSEHRICGSLIGSIASYPRQNDFLGLPMALLPEEAALLVEKGICELFVIPNLTKPPTDEHKKVIIDLENNVLQEQSEALRKRRIEQLSQKIDIIVAGKKKKLLSKGITDVQLDKQSLLDEEIAKLPKISPAHFLVHIPTESIKNSAKIRVNTTVLIPSIRHGEGSLKLAVFKDLWERGHHITCGSKFGCDYLVYPGDPVKFHATYMVRCVLSKDTLFRPSTIVAFGRLSVAVNKLAVFAYSNVFGNIEYQTLQWHDSINQVKLN